MDKQAKAGHNDFEKQDSESIVLGLLSGPSQKEWSLYHAGWKEKWTCDCSLSPTNQMKYICISNVKNHTARIANPKKGKERKQKDNFFDHLLDSIFDHLLDFKYTWIELN